MPVGSLPTGASSLRAGVEWCEVYGASEGLIDPPSMAIFLENDG